MEWSGNFHRLNEMKQLIFEIAAGNFSYRLEPKDRQDEGETIIALLNMMTEELKSLFHQINPEESAKYLVQASWILDEDFQVLGASPQVLSFFEIDSSQLFKHDFTAFLAKESKKNFIREIQKLNGLDSGDHKRLSLEFKAPNSLIVAAECSFQKITLFPELERILVTAFKIVYRNQELEEILKNSMKSTEDFKKGGSKALRLESYRKIIQKLYLKILENLDKPLPKFKAMAQEIGASESKLRRGFKAIYGDTVYNFHREKRFEKAVMLLTNTEQSIKQISLDCGFKSASHFSRKFKKRFGVKPSHLR
ncbi:hypothetical protein GCM10007103_12910 [Salinimicrobium marinum]|uniref:HTH araC/xylS-type domain-containing protein n=1 Tax=Salinimicrobium marinum TaxID=680283 RepID=A0A918SC77_9FLAO|nr:helix-turn-helix domain-containing protein [Salinimicrobium marinum]GHA32881.1 hypothetical protein GCM10007103_12910 [Salinimicrobium marinum]